MTALSLRRKSQPRPVTVRSHRWVQSVDQPSEWAQEHRWLLEAAFAAFADTGEWPLIEDVQASLAAEPEHAIAVAQLVIDMPSELGARHSQNVQLTVRALVHVPAAAGLLDLFVQALREAVSLYPGDGPQRPTLRGLDLKRKFDLAPLAYRKLVALFNTEGWFFGDGAATPTRTGGARSGPRSCGSATSRTSTGTWTRWLAIASAHRRSRSSRARSRSWRHAAACSGRWAGGSAGANRPSWTCWR